MLLGLKNTIFDVIQTAFRPRLQKLLSNAQTQNLNGACRNYVINRLRLLGRFINCARASDETARGLTVSWMIYWTVIAADNLLISLFLHFMRRIEQRRMRLAPSPDRILITNDSGPT